MSQVTVTTTTSPQMTVVCSGALPITATVTIAPTDVDLEASDQLDMVPPPLLNLKDTMRGAVGLTTVMLQQLPQSQMPSQTYANYAISPPWVSSVSELSLPLILYVSNCYGVFFLLSGSQVAAMFTSAGSTITISNTATLQSAPLVGICAS